MVVGVLNHAHVGEQALGRQQTHFLVEDGAEELIGGAEALHKDISLTVMNHTDSLGHGLELVFYVHNLKLTHINLALLAHFGYEVGVSHQGYFHKTHIRSQGSGLNGVGIHAPGSYHFLANTLCLELGKQIVKIGNHFLILGFQVLNAWYRGQSPAPRWCR